MTGRRLKLFLLITKSNWGGAQRYVHDMASNLPKEEFQTTIILGGSGFLKNKLDSHKIPTVSLSSLERDVNILKDIQSFFELVKIFIREKPDIVHLNSSKIGGLASLAARVSGVKKIIFTAHGLASNEENRSSVEKIIIKILYRVIGLFSHKIIAVSNNLRKELENIKVSPKKIRVIHNGIDIPELKNRDEARNSLLKKNRKLKNLETKNPTLWIGMLGELHPVKGHTYAIGAMEKIQKEFPNTRLIICGEGDLKKDLEIRIKKRNLMENCFLMGQIPDGHLYLKAFDIFLMPSLSEGLGYSILEAGEASLPVIASSVGGIPEVIQHRESGLLVPTKDSRAITDAIISLLENEAMRKRLGTELRQTVRNHFSLDKMVEETIKVYRD